MFSICSDCLICKCSGGCLAGSGDDDFVPMEMEEITEMINSKYHRRWRRNLTEQEVLELVNYKKKFLGVI